MLFEVKPDEVEVRTVDGFGPAIMKKAKMKKRDVPAAYGPRTTRLQRELLKIYRFDWSSVAEDAAYD